jgi:hypothetical protein
MPEKIEIAFSLTKRASDALQKYMQDSCCVSPIPAILWGKEAPEMSEHWMLEIYDQVSIVGDFPGYLIDVSGVVFIIPQAQVIDALDGKQLDYVKGTFKVA